MEMITVQEASKLLGELVQRARAGEKVVIVDEHGPIAELVPSQQVQVAEPRRPDALAGVLQLPDDFFFDPLPADEEALWWGASAAGK